MALAQQLNGGSWAPERFWWLLKTVGWFRGPRWTLEGAQLAGSMVTTGRAWDVELAGRSCRVTREIKGGMSVVDAGSGQTVASTGEIYLDTGGPLRVGRANYNFKPGAGSGWGAAGEGWTPGEARIDDFIPHSEHQVLDDAGRVVLTFSSTGLIPRFPFSVVSPDLEDGDAFHLLALASALTIRAWTASRGARRAVGRKRL